MQKPTQSTLKTASSLALSAWLALAGSASAAVLLSDNFNVVSGNSQNVNQDLGVRQSGPLAPATYTGFGSQHQVGNTGTDVGQPGGASNSGYVLLAGGSFQSDVDIARMSTGPLTIDVDMYNTGSGGGGDDTHWVSFTMRREGQTFVVAGGGEFGFLKRVNGGVQVFQNGSSIAPGSWNNVGSATNAHWTLIFSDTAGTGSAFVGNGSQVTMINGTTTLGTLTLSQLNRSGLKVGFGQDTRYAGIDNLSIAVAGTLPAVSVTTTNESGGNPFTPDWVTETPSLIAGLAPSTANGDFAKESSGGTPVLTDGTIGTSGTIGGFATCGGGGGSGSTLIYTLTNVINGTDVTNIVVYSGWGDGGRHGQYYDLSYSTIAAPTTFIPITTVFYLPGSYSGAPANRVAIAMSNGTRLASGVANIKFDFSGPPNAGSFNNGYQGYSEIFIQGKDTATPPPPPSPYLTQDTLPTYVETSIGDSVVFTADFSNSPPRNMQWQVIKSSATNDIPGATTATLSLGNVQLTDSGLYRLKAVNSTNGTAAPSYSTPSQLVVGTAPVSGNVVINYAGQMFPSSTNFFPPWLVDTNSLIWNYTYSATPTPGTFNQISGGTGSFSAGGACNPDATIMSDGVAGSFTSTPALIAVAGGPTINSVGSSITYTLANTGTFGYDLTNITVFGGWADEGRNEQKYQILYATVSAPTTFVPLVTADYAPTTISGNLPTVTRTTLLPVTGVLARNVVAVKLSFDVSPQPKNGWEGYTEFVVQGVLASGIAPNLVNAVNPKTAADVVGGQIKVSAAFGNYTSLQWKKNGTNVIGATSATLTLNNLSTNDAGAYTLVASNPFGSTSSGSCAVTVKGAPVAVSNIVMAIAEQTSDAPVFTPSWDTSTLGASLIAGLTPSSVGPGDFTGGTFGSSPPTACSDPSSAPSVLTDGTFGTADFYVTTAHACWAAMGTGAGTGNGFGGQSVTYTLPPTANGYDLTNIMTAGGWNDGGRDEQAYTVYYSTLQNPDMFLPLLTVDFNPTNPVGYSMNRITLTPATGVLATNVAALRFDMNFPRGENGYSGYSEFAVYGKPSATPPAAVPVITAQHEEVSFDYVVEIPNLIANQLPSSTGAGVFTEEGCNVTNLTDGAIGFGSAFGASCGADGVAVPWLVFNASSGWNLTNIVVYSLWNDYGRDGQFYSVSYSTLSNPTTFVPLATVGFSPDVLENGIASANRVTISPMIGQTTLATNVAAVKFDFTSQGIQDYGWTGYSEIVLQGNSLAAPAQPIVNSTTVSGGNLILTGMSATTNYSYTVLSSTNLLTPLANWTVVATGVTTVTGAISNAIPMNPSQPARFLRVRMP